MRLKSVRIFGFKTFAEPTEFALEGGIVAVVGPNGCGKSNLVDAILWGLGEPNARHLRANVAQEVIFSGSSRRKGVGYCEVTLLFDNEDRLLPIESPEVALGRRLSRNGESDYSINRRSCRQRDVFELLADSGLGRTGYAIIGQRHIDSATSASSDERRSWIDEAAGVQRYRQRKLEATRKLESAREHLLRVGDILSELDAQREPLREQADQAAEYRRIHSTLKTTEVGYLSYEAVQAARDQARFKEQIEVANKLLASESFRAAAHETNLAALANELAALDKSVQHEQEQDRLQSAAAAKCESEIRLCEAKLEALDEQEAAFLTDRQVLAARIAEAELEVESCGDQYRQEQELATEIRVAAVGASEETQRLAERLDDADRKLRQAVAAEAQRAKRQLDREHRLEQRELAERALKSLERNFSALEANVLEAKTGIALATARLEELKASGKVLISEELAVKAEEDRQANALRSTLAERAALEGRERGVEETIQSFEGMSQGAKSVMEAHEKGALQGDFVPVGHVVQTEPETALAIETALGAAVNDLIVGSDVECKAAVEYLKRNRAGRATFQPIEFMRPASTGPELQSLLHQKGILGLADQLVSCNAKYRPVIQSLLGRCLIAESLDVALRFARTRGWSKMATLEGELIFSSGAVSGGANARQAYGVVQRKADLIRLRKQIDALTEKVELFHQSSRQRQDRATKIQSDLKVLRESMSAQEDLVAEAKAFLRVVEDELKSAVRDREKLERELAVEIPAHEPPSVPLREFEEVREVALRSLASHSADAQAFGERLREADKRLLQSKQRLDAALRRREQELHSEDARVKRAEGLEPARERFRAMIAEERKRREDHALKAEAACQSLIFLETQKERRNAEREIESSGLAASRASCTDANEMIHHAELNRTRAEARKFAALSRLAEEYSIAETEVSDAPPAPTPDAPAVIGRLKRELRVMGDVNMGAIEAFDRLTARYSELNSQREDILGAIGEVEGSIVELDRLTRERFAVTFAAVQEAFAQTFARLFEGGMGAVELTDREDILTSGIEIQAVLPGKRRQPLNLLSGGEQSLCTTAFLFALLQVKPSPLVVLDEIDAPLDGRNVERFATFLKDLSRQMQFIVITHNPVTIEAADTWLGVTMQEPGVSKLIYTKPSAALASDVRSA
jgi:chromosome segregation protein